MSNGTGIRLRDRGELPYLQPAALNQYEVTVKTEAARLWREFERTPCNVNLNSWRGFVDAWVEPVHDEQTWRLLRSLIADNGRGGIAV